MTTFNKYTLYSLLLLVISLSACKKNFDPVITGVLSPDNFPRTEADFNLYTLQAYKPFGSKWGYNDVAYQNMFFSPEYGHLAMFDLSTDLFNTFSEWGGFWEFFSRANFTFLWTQDKTSHFEKVRYVTGMTQVLKDIATSSISEEAKNRFSAEARMGRGMAMYYLLHMYGPLPVILDPEKINTEAEKDLTRLSREAFVASIESDLQFAADHLVQSPTEYGRFNKGLAMGYLMRLYLNEKNWQRAEAVGREMMGMGYALVDDYASLFREGTERNNETIYAISVDPTAPTSGNFGGNFNAYAMYCLPGDFQSTKISGGWANPNGVFCPTWQFYDSFDPADKRRTLMVPSYTAKDGRERNRSNMRGPVLKKYPDESSPGADVQGNDIPLLRYADVLLMLAEAINQQQGPTAEAFNLVNEVRAKHAGLGPLSSDLNQAQLNDAILQERAWDLYLEGVRKMDLIRHGKWVSSLKEVGKIPSGELFPVPQYALDVSGGTLTQTTGY
ncbi:RagB/SusD family nutrient uptake outer membrane protein [Olivibacter sp. LS-1]|uniref:RagB/SusD family nutrient uptake outer membrane protein n=1 Tax=Olivibacter sp. LS-1 TaxID=2592345 RepID=UPI0011EAB829|nr:RagB/SusD family nutrient uptake outer membrane protein [Olivibacter sp. LS-1]QEL03152.1 RagB/SusD family nutrient uptake outer membrane protein [Olivibacter sp. LS-1]